MNEAGSTSETSAFPANRRAEGSGPQGILRFFLPLPSTLKTAKWQLWKLYWNQHIVARSSVSHKNIERTIMMIGLAPRERSNAASPDGSAEPLSLRLFQALNTRTFEMRIERRFYQAGTVRLCGIEFRRR